MQKKIYNQGQRDRYPCLILPFVLLLVALVRALWIKSFPTNPVEPVDAEGFMLLAQNIRAGHGFAIAWEAPFCPNTVRTPLYPAFLAMCFGVLGPHPHHIVLVQLLLEVLTGACVIRLAMLWLSLLHRRKRRYIGGAFAGIFYAINGTTQRFTGYLFAENLLLPLLSLAVLFSVQTLHRPSRRRAARAALFWALAVLTKPNVQYLALGTGVMLIIYDLLHAPGAPVPWRSSC
ncbi:MAG: hypothetical protein P1S60_20270, partial [Anaerolineae bacterium]|nr:hypothetical protein [Anaerolineae bacterium]